MDIPHLISKLIIWTRRVGVRGKLLLPSGWFPVTSWFCHLLPMRATWGLIREGVSLPCDLHLKFWHLFPRRSSKFLVSCANRLGLLILWVPLTAFMCSALQDQKPETNTILWISYSLKKKTRRIPTHIDSSYQLGKRCKVSWDEEEQLLSRWLCIIVEDVQGDKGLCHCLTLQHQVKIRRNNHRSLWLKTLVT